MNSDNFVRKAISKFGDKYDYSFINYKNNNTKVDIVCGIHGPFRQTPAVHLKSGCPQCSKETQRWARQSKLLEKFKTLGEHFKTDFYYISSDSKFSFYCKNHGFYQQTIKNHIQGRRCKKCANAKNLLENQSKIRETNLKKFGSEFYSKSDHFKKRKKEILQKKQKTFLKNYNSRNFFSSKFFLKNRNKYYEKAKSTNFIKYGTRWAAQSEIIKNKIRATNINRYGVSRHTQYHITNFKDINKQFIESNFIDPDTCYFNINDMMSYFNIKETSCYRYLKKFNILFKYRPAISGFNPDKPATLYYIYDPQEDLYKIGITNKSLEERFGKEFCSNRAIALFEQTYENGQEAYLAEQEILEAFGYARCINPSWPQEKGGRTEFFSYDILELNKD